MPAASADPVVAEWAIATPSVTAGQVRSASSIGIGKRRVQPVVLSASRAPGCRSSFPQSGNQGKQRNIGGQQNDNGRDDPDVNAHEKPPFAVVANMPKPGAVTL
jgi:hypothetical protein